MLIRAQFRQMVDALRAGTFIALVVERPPASTKTIPQEALLYGHVSAVVLLLHRQVLQRGAARGLRQDSGLCGSVFK